MAFTLSVSGWRTWLLTVSVSFAFIVIQKWSAGLCDLYSCVSEQLLNMELLSWITQLRESLCTDVHSSMTQSTALVHTKISQHPPDGYHEVKCVNCCQMIYFDDRLGNRSLTFLVAGLSPSHGPWILSLFPYNDSLSLHGFTLVPCCCCILIQRFGFSLMTRSVFVNAFLFLKLNLDISVCGSPRCHCVGFSTLMSGFTLKPHCALLHCFLFCFHSLAEFWQHLHL